MQFTRFEKKIVAAMAAVAIVPLVATLVLGRVLLDEVYSRGFNPLVGAQLDQGLEAQRAHLLSLRHDAERTADLIAYHAATRDAVRTGEAEPVRRQANRFLRDLPSTARLVFETQEGGTFVQAERAERLDEELFDLVPLRRSVPGTELVVEATIAVPAGPYRRYLRAGEFRGDYAVLEHSGGTLSGFYLAVYFAFLLSVIVVAMALGVVLSRRVTRRVADVADATQRVGAGDLTVEVPSDARDEVGELTRAFNTMVRQLRESRERIVYLQRIGAWQQFARRLAHEIKNPLTPIQLAIQEVDKSYDGPDDKFRERLGEARTVIEEEVHTLRRLVGEFSAFAKLPEAQLSDADLSDFVADAERSFAQLHEAEGAELIFRPGNDVIPVRIDAMMLKRCVDNLIRNALDSVRGTDGAKVIVAARATGDAAWLEVRDSGEGIPEESRQRVFDPYFTTKADGTGLGLAIVKKIVLEHGGEIDCGEAEEGGAAFRIRLPIT
jgi:nitrogen fixation/metabolism regulation signal transduction histidine kinase